jgi:glycosyltransferase involved in cell wall biosynthesis
VKFSKVYIISWQGKRDIAPARLSLLEKNIAWCKRIGLEPTVIAMEWDDMDYRYIIGTPRIEIPHRLPPAHARNIALNLFYATDDDYVLILDDDTWIAQGDSIIRTLQGMTEQEAAGLDLLTVLDSHEQSVYFRNHKNHYLCPLTIIVSGVFIVKNIPKYHTTDLFFNTRFRVTDGDRHDLMYGEDVNFGHRALMKNLGAYSVFSSCTNEHRKREITPSTWMGAITWGEMEPYGSVGGYVGKLAIEEFGKIPKPIGTPFIVQAKNEI